MPSDNTGDDRRLDTRHPQWMLRLESGQMRPWIFSAASNLGIFGDWKIQMQFIIKRQPNTSACSWNDESKSQRSGRTTPAYM